MSFLIKALSPFHEVGEYLGKSLCLMFLLLFLLSSGSADFLGLSAGYRSMLDSSRYAFKGSGRKNLGLELMSSTSFTH